MSLILSKRSLCSDPADYESLLPSITMIKNLLDCNREGKTEAGVATQLINKLFGAHTGVWANVNDATEDVFHSCFYETNVYYNKKSCGDEVGIASVVWNPAKNSALETGISNIFTELGGAIGGDSPHFGKYQGPFNDPAMYKSFKDITELLVAFLAKVASNPTAYDLENVIQTLDCLCEVVEQKVSINRVLRKTGLTIDHCDF